jgi:hypothetical protein
LSSSGREVVIVEAVRTPIGRGHAEKGYSKHSHPNALLGSCYTEVIEHAALAGVKDRPESARRGRCAARARRR